MKTKVPKCKDLASKQGVRCLDGAEVPRDLSDCSNKPVPDGAKEFRPQRTARGMRTDDSQTA